MAKLTRKLKKIFSSNSPSDIGVWGSINATTSTDPDVLQGTGYETGVSSAEVSGKKLLPRKDFNGLKYETDYHLSYLYQSGIPEYDASTEYHIGSIVKDIDSAIIYKSITADNVSNPLTDSENWGLCGDLGHLQLANNRNSIINGDFSVAQRGTVFDSTTTPANNDDTYLLDRWLLLSDGNDACDVSQESSLVPTGARNAIKLEAKTADKQFGICQIIEASEVKRYVGGNASLSFKARTTSSGIANIQAAVVAWDGTADSVTSDVIATWASTPTFAANWTAENTPSDLALTNSYQTFKIENISIDTSSLANLAVFIWVADTTITVGDLLYVGEAQLEKSSVATDFEHTLFGQHLRDCQRRFCKSYVYAARLKQTSFSNPIRGDSLVSGGGDSITGAMFPVTMAGVPTVTIYNPSTGSINSVYRVLTAGANSVTNASGVGDSGFRNIAASGSSLSAGEQYDYHYSADAEL
tara:strand:- start:12492 stop:13898 length:1407 start_codon:yes stop_codon:yes gene_type:complete